MPAEAPSGPENRAQLLGFLNNRLERFHNMKSVRIPQTNRRGLLMLYGPIMQVIRFARSAAHLINDGLEIDAQVLARSALEYAITIQYAYLRVDGLDRLEKDNYLKRKELFEDLAKWNDDKTYLELIPTDKPRPGAKGMPKLTQILDIMDPEHVYLQTTYAVLSQVTHVRPGGQTRYFEMDGDELVLNPGRSDDGFGNLSVGALAFAVMAVSWVFAHLTEDHDDMKVLDEYSDRLHIPIRYDGDWPEKDRAHPE